MMYNQKMVASIRVKGKILREFKDTVYVPFGSEYSILLKNLHTTRAVVNVFIDGVDMVPGGLVLNAGQSVDLERSIKNGNLTEGNRFKFIERTEQIEQHKGIGVEDGLVRVEYQFEIPRPVINVNQIFGGMPSQYPNAVDKYSKDLNSGWIQASGATYSQVNVNGALRGVDYSANGAAMQASAAAAINKVAPQASEMHDGMATMDWCANETGITVPGSKSEQKFQTTTVGALELTKHSIVLRIVGDLGHNKPVTKPVTVFTHQKCTTCGRKNKAHSKFCVECGTALELFA